MANENTPLPIPDPDKRPADRAPDALHFKDRFAFWYGIYEKFAVEKDRIARIISENGYPSSNTLKQINFPTYEFLGRRVKEHMRGFLDALEGDPYYPIERELSDVMYWLAVTMVSYGIAYDRWCPDIYFKDATFIPGNRLSLDARLEEVLQEIDLTTQGRALATVESVLMYTVDALLESGRIPRGVAHKMLARDLDTMRGKPYLKQFFEMSA